MLKNICWLLTIVLTVSKPLLLANQTDLISNESDPDAFVQNCVNVIDGSYCETVTDLVITGPDNLILKRFYNSKDSTETSQGGWKIYPERFLVIGRDLSGKECQIGQDRFEWTSAYIGECTGGVLPYCGWRNANGTTKDPLKIDILNQAQGMVNTYAVEINGQTNRQNNLLHCKGDKCELTLGDGTKRIYKKVQSLPTLFLGEEFSTLTADRVAYPDYFLLTQEILPSGNQLFFIYDENNHLTVVEMKNKSSTKVLSWIHLSYEFQEKGCRVNIETSDSKVLTYILSLENSVYELSNVEGSHSIPISYSYSGALSRKNLPEGRFVGIDYQDGKVKSLSGPNAQSGKQEIMYVFSYGNDYTDVFDAMGIRTRYIYDNRFQLTRIERYDEQNNLYRVDQKFWGQTKGDTGLLMAKTIGDGSGRIYSYRSFRYDKAGNITEERLYGNLTGKQECVLQVSIDGQLLNPDEEECHLKTFGYSLDGFNLLTKIGDCKGNSTLYTYQAGTNLLIKKLIFEKANIKKRTFQSYNNDGVCTKIIEDDGSKEDGSWTFGVSERHIKEIKPKETLPGVGLPEIIEDKCIDINKNREVLIKKLVNSYDDQSNLLSCSTYDANAQFAFTEKRTYDNVGQITSQIDAVGRESIYTYDGVGNQITCFIPHENRRKETEYDFYNNPIKITEINGDEQVSFYNTYDILGRKISSTDSLGNTTYYEYDAFHRLNKVIFPEVLDENNRIIRPTFCYTFDIFGNVLSTTDPQGFVTTKTYNLRGDPTKTSYPDGSFELFKYDAEGSLHRSLNRENIITVYEYDYLGRSIYEESSIANQTGISSYVKSYVREYNGFRCIYEKDYGHVKRYSFDPAGRLTSIVEYFNGTSEKSKESRRTDIDYDLLGRVHQRRVWFDMGPYDFSVECYDYDLSGNIIEKRIEDAQGNILLQRFFTYNLQDLCTEEYCLENGVKTHLIQTVYNSLGKATAYIDALGNETKIIMDHKYQNALGQTVSKKIIVNPMGIQIEIEFDALGRVNSLSKKDPFGILLSAQKILYDALGNKAAEIHDQIVNGKILSFQKTQWNYGPMGRLDEEIQAAESPLQKHIRYHYNTFGKLVSKTMSGVTEPINYTYSKYGDLEKIEFNSNKHELRIFNSYSYDDKGNIVEARSLYGKSVQRAYNVFNQITKEIVKDGEGTYVLQFAYDRKGRIKEIVLPDLSKIAYKYDAVFGREVSRISPQGDILYTHTYENYDKQGKLLYENHIGYAGAHKYDYNANGQKISSKTDFYLEEYTRDHLGRITEIKGEKTKEYSYNALSQLTSEKNVGAYLYDSLDNCIKSNDDDLSYNALNQLTSHSGITCSYDHQGNLLKKVLDGEETRFENNILSQLISIDQIDQTSLTFSYDALGRVLTEKHFGAKGDTQSLSTSRYLYLGYQEIGTLSKEGTIETLKIPGLQGDELSLKSIAFEIKGEIYVPIHDIAGNVTSLIDPQTRQIIESYTYTAFGEESILNENDEQVEFSTIGNPWRFAEKRIDTKSGLILFGHRFYDPEMGRWISQDPSEGSDGPNLYAYLHNNPLGYLDRFGLASETNTQTKFEEYFYGEVEPHCYCERHRTCKRGGDIGKTVGSNFPKIKYCNDFEQFYSKYKPSRQYDLSDFDPLTLWADIGIGFTNGIWNDFDMAMKSTQYISRLSGGYNIDSVHNATHGFLPDLKECKAGLDFIATDPVRLLHNMWNSFFKKSSATARFLMICHSQGAIHVRNALLDYPPELRERILVVAIAPAAYIYHETCAEVIHYRAAFWRDFIPRIDNIGAQREKKTIVNLDSHPNAPIFDHEFTSPTYEPILWQHITNYIRSSGEML